MNLDDLIKTNPVVLLAISIAGITLIIYKLIPSINSLVAAALTRRGWTKKGQDTEADIDPIQILTELNRQTQEAVKALVITLQLQIETNNQRDQAAAQRDSRLVTLADMITKSVELGTKQIENIGRLTESIAQLALTGNTQNTQISQQTLKLSELVGQFGATRQLGEDTHITISKAVETVDENTKQLGETNQRITELKEQLAKVEKKVSDEVLPTLHGIRALLDNLATRADVSQIGPISDKLNFIEAEVKALIVTISTPPTSSPPTDKSSETPPAPPPATAIIDSKPLEKAVKPPEGKPNEPTTHKPG